MMRSTALASFPPLRTRQRTRRRRSARPSPLRVRSHVDISPPFREGAVPDCDRRQPKGRDIVLHWHRRYKDVAREGMINAEDRQQPFAQMPPILQRKAAHASNRVARQPALDFNLDNCRMPGGLCIEIPNCRPDLLDLCTDNRTSHNRTSHNRTSQCRRRSAAGRCRNQPRSRRALPPRQPLADKQAPRPWCRRC
jgi:hypothetical protein